MRFVRTAILATLGTAVVAGAAMAADRTMLVAFPDGSVQHVALPDEAAAPRIILIQTPVSPFANAFGPGSPFAEMERISVMMDAQADAMMRQASMMQAQAHSQAASPQGKGIVMTNAQGEPVGVMQYSFTSSTITADGCTQTISYSSDDATADQPRVIRTSVGNCANAAPAPAIGSGRAPVARITPTAVKPVARPKPRITPVSAPKPLPDFTPSRT